METILRIRKLKKYFPITKGFLKKHIGDVQAVHDVSFDINQGETLGLVGESGSGKTTVGRTIMRLYKPTSGTIEFNGRQIENLEESELGTVRKKIQMIFQDPYGSLNPRMNVGQIIAEPYAVHKIGTKKNRISWVKELLEQVGLDPDFRRRFPHQFSGGQRQRIGIARALALKPEFIICDEPIASLDVSVQAQVVNLLEDLQDQYNLTYLFISHDLSMIQHLSDRVAVMYLGEIMELADKDELYENHRHPYTKALMSAIPVPDPDLEMKRERIILSGTIPSPSQPPSGCYFHTRCPYAKKKCRELKPDFVEISKGHYCACHYV